VFYRSRLFLRLLTVGAFVLLAVGSGYIFGNNQIEPNDEIIDEPDIAKLRADLAIEYENGTALSNNEQGIMIKENDGYIAIYKAETTGLRLIKQTTFNIDKLEPWLQTRIKQGIAVDTPEEVEHLLESWDS